MPFTDDQIAHIKRIQDERGISYKSAVQYMRRLSKKTTVDIETIVDGVPAITIQEPGKPAVVIPVYTTQPNTPDVAAPVDQTETIISDVPSLRFTGPIPTTVSNHAAAVPALINGRPIVDPPVHAEGGSPILGYKWNVEMAIAMYKSGTKQIDIAEAMGYPRGSGQTRVRRALQQAGVWTGAH